MEVSKKSEWEREFARFVGVGLNVATLSCQSEFDGNQEIYAAACLQNTFVERDEASMIKAPPRAYFKTPDAENEQRSECGEISRLIPRLAHITVTLERSVTRPATRGGGEASLEKCVVGSLKPLDIIKKIWSPLRKPSASPNVPGRLRAWV